VLIGLSPFLLIEATFAILDWGRPRLDDDPFVGFRSIRPLFELNEETARYQTAASRLGYFRPDGFARRKPPGGFRIFCLGGSTVQGRPWGIETSFTTWLKLALQAADPERSWEVVNCGGISYASYRLVPVLEEVLGYEPDLIVLYTGHNEFLEDRTYRRLKYMPEVVARPCELLLRTRTFTLLRSGYLRVHGQDARAGDGHRPVLQTEVEAMLDYKGGLAQYHRDPRWRRDVIEHYRYNVRRMVEMTQRAGVEMLLVNPTCNLRDWPPLKTQHREGLAPPELDRWEALVARAAEQQGANVYDAVLALEEALSIDDQHAGLHYLLAKCHDAMGAMDRARGEYLAAKEQDICPLRILEPMNQAVLEIARQTGAGLVDARAIFERQSEGGIPGGFLLVDHVHPSFSGHKLIAAALVQAMIRRGLVDPVEGWEEACLRKYEEHFASLESLYFDKGQENLDILRCWMQGKASRPHPKFSAGDSAD
jgi:lysophospholipase L1-like esterase